MILILSITFTLILLGIIERYRHQRLIHKIPIRIHVNGTRGKTMLVRMIAEMFTRAGKSVTAKVTGEQPQFYTSENGWQRWKRRGVARIKEQMVFIRKIATKKPDVLVLENMALQPENQYVSESHMMQSTLSVYSNIRPDHQEVMGANINDISQTLAYSFPKNGTIIILQRNASKHLVDWAAANKSQFIPVQPDAAFHHHSLPVFDESFALLKQIQFLHQLPDDSFEETVTHWKQSLTPDKFVLPVEIDGEKKYLINLFSCNDVESASELLLALENSMTIERPYTILLTCRSDRPLRTLTFLKWICTVNIFSHLILAGGVPILPVRRLLKHFDIPRSDIHFVPRINSEKIISALNGSSNYILGLGNYVRTGEKIISYLKKEPHDH